MNLCNYLLRIKIYTLLAIVGVALLIVFLIWRESTEDISFISERQFDYAKAYDNNHIKHFRSKFKHKNIHMFVSGYKAFPKQLVHKNRMAHASEEELKSAKTGLGTPLAPFVLIQGSNNEGYSAQSWLKYGALKLITGYNHNAYAIDIPGQGQTKINGKLKRDYDFFKGIFNHWNWPRIILIATGTSISSIVQLAVDDLAQFEIHVQGVVLIHTGDTTISNYQNMDYLKLLTRVKVLLIYSDEDKSESVKYLDRMFDQLMQAYKQEVEAGAREKKIPPVHSPIVSKLPGRHKFVHFENADEFLRVLENYIQLLDNEF